MTQVIRTIHREHVSCGCIRTGDSALSINDEYRFIHHRDRRSFAKSASSGAVGEEIVSSDA
ncbi:hypothetical protein C463_00025 [Halorubrum californiense DSM 19288]|uniref:Uncharacterized protein n=1 Tax=Halorubrum californiense DSM 19288 TaxID=1227465 RepID=M0EN50_9EURY|nr:hypothetical protein C463_00025 [Halorubrum californiense DSM 19288]